MLGLGAEVRSITEFGVLFGTRCVWFAVCWRLERYRGFGPN